MSIDVNIADIRDGYEREGLTKKDMQRDPVAQFNRWMDEAVEAKLSQPNALTLATASKEGRPSARIVLLKEVTVDGFVFFTNYEGRKGQELKENPQAAMVFLWPSLSRQIRVNGIVSRVPEAVSDAYYATRPKGSQLGAWASPQSQVVENRQYLEKALQEVEQKYAEVNPPRPPHWGGYCLKPEIIEFWQGRPNRLHDRLRYSAGADETWILERLAP